MVPNSDKYGIPNRYNCYDYLFPIFLNIFSIILLYLRRSFVIVMAESI